MAVKRCSFKQINVQTKPNFVYSSTVQAVAYSMKFSLRAAVVAKRFITSSTDGMSV